MNIKQIYTYLKDNTQEQSRTMNLFHVEKSTAQLQSLPQSLSSYSVHDKNQLQARRR